MENSEWPKARVVHSHYQKSATRAALEPLGSHLVCEIEDRNQGVRYSITAAGVLLTEGGGKYRSLLLRYFEYLRRLFIDQPDKMHVESGEVTSALGLTREQTRMLGLLLELRPFYDGSSSQDGWMARVRPEVEDFPPVGDLDEALDGIFDADRQRSESVFIEKRREASSRSFSFVSLPDYNHTAYPTHIDALKKRYQVFVSSTYEDLVEERRHVMQALLETKCIPTGMELFPAASTDQWNLIKRIIDECDYYIVVVAGRYGSIGKAGIGYTEQEFDYAVEIGKPVIGFYHRDLNALPGAKLESRDEARAKLGDFTKKIKARLCRPWLTPAELGSGVKSAILNELEFNPRPGWVRADSVFTPEGVEKLKQRVADLEEQLKRAESKSQVNQYRTQDLGSEFIEIKTRANYCFEAGSNQTSDEVEEQITVSWTWDRLLMLFSEQLKERTGMTDLRITLESAIAAEYKVTALQKAGSKVEWIECEIDETFFDRIINTLASRKLVRLDLPRSTEYSAEMQVRFATAGIARVADLKAL